MWTRKLLFLALGALALLAFAYGNHYQNGFHFDDPDLIENNVSIQSPANFVAIWTERSAASVEEKSQIFRPLASLSLAADYWRAGMDVRAYHHTASALYVTLLVLLFVCSRKLALLSFDDKTSSAIALGTAAVFAFHAVNAETLNYISARGILLGANLALLGFYLYLQGGWVRSHRTYLVPLVLAILSDQNFICVPVLIFLHHLVFESHDGEPAMRRLKRAAVSASPAFVVSVFAVSLVILMSSQEAQRPPSLEHLLTQPYVIAEYVAAFFYPIGLSAASGVSPFSDFDSWRSICGQVFFLCLAALASLALRGARLRVAGFGLLWFILALLPSACLFGSDMVLDYRRTFFAYPGLSFAICCGAAFLIESARLRNRWHPRYLSYASTVLLIILAVHILVTRQRNRVWLNEETLWFDVLAKNPGYGPAYMSYGHSKMAKNDYDLARLYLEEALKYLPDSPELNTDLGTLHGKITKDPGVAERYFTHAMTIAPEYAPAYVAYGRWLVARKNYDAAILNFEKALDLNENSLQASYALMDTYSDLGRWAKVREVARRTLALRPEDPVAQKELMIADTRPAEDARRGVKSSGPPAQRPPSSSQTQG